jgi:hypothetical protein
MNNPTPKPADEILAILILQIFKRLDETDVLSYDDASELVHEIVEELPPISKNAQSRINQVLITLFQLRI